MSNKKPPQPRIDKRANRTRHALAQAMIDLGGRDGVDKVTPGALAREAGVSRSTFYANFASKDDYLDRAFAGMFLSCERADDSGILPSWHFFKHVYDAKDFAVSMAKSETFPQYLAAREEFFRERATLSLKSAMPQIPAVEIANLASMLAGAFAGLMRQWMETGLKTSPEVLHASFDTFCQRSMREG